MIVERNIPCKMRDGVTLYADVYRPDVEGRFPVLMLRTPYDKDNIALAIGTQVHPVHAAQRGYAVIMQDVRGMYTSEGDFEAFASEENDGYDTIQWAAALPYSNGKVGMFGGSYTGVTQILAAAGRPPSLLAITPRHTSANYFNDWTYQDGAFLLAFNYLWSITLSMGELGAKKLGQKERRRQSDVLVRASDDFRRVISRLPLSSTDVFQRIGRAHYFGDWLDHPSYDRYWMRVDAARRFDEMDVAGFHFAGWYDIFLRGTLGNYLGMASRSARPQRLVIGPWIHGTDLGSRIGEWDSGFLSQGSALGVEALQLRWFDRWLKGVENGVDKEPPVLIYVMGENLWREEAQWPLARAELSKFYLHSGGNANTLGGDGLLGTSPPKKSERPDEYVYDPLEPVPTKGGATTGTYPAALNDGVYDQREIEKRSDVLVYTSEVMREDTEVTGPVKLSLFASTSEPDTDFTAKLIDVHPDGYARNLCDGVIRGRYRESFEKPTLLKQGSVYNFPVDLIATSNLFRRGHRIRLEVSSSNFPKFDRNLNTGADYSKNGDVRKASQSVFHDAEHPSCLALPLVPRESRRR